MNLRELTLRLQANHHHNLQACQTISAAVAEVEHGLAMLARMGHVLHLEPGPPYDLPEWPRVLFHVESAPNGRVVNSWWEANDLGAGWWPTLAEAQQREGIRAQFAGRGGIGDRSLPMLVDGGPAGPRPEPMIPPKENGGIIEEWKRSIAGVRSAGDGAWGNVTIHTGGAEESDRTGDPGVSPETATSQDIPGESGMGDQRPGDDGTEDRICNAGGITPSGIPEDVVSGEPVQDSEERRRRSDDNFRRVLDSSARTLAAARAARDEADRRANVQH